MLKPSSTKLLNSADIADLVAAFHQRGGVIEKLADGCSSHLNSSKYVGRTAMRGAPARLGAPQK